MKRKAPICGSRTWTKSELLTLEEEWGRTSIPTLAKNLNRTPEAVVLKAQRIGLGAFLLSGDYVTLNQLVIAVKGRNTGSYYMTSWVKNRGLPVHTKRVKNNSFRVVKLDEFWAWAEKNRSFIDFSKFEPYSLGAEPEWVAEQRRLDYKAFSLQRKDPWTTAEDEKLKTLLKKYKYGYAELSKMLQRSAGAIQRRCLDLGLSERPVKADNYGESAKWKDEDYEILAEGIRSGCSYTDIGARIGKSEKAVRGKVYFVYLTENADRVRSLMGDGPWGFGAPLPTVKQAVNLSRTRSETKALIGSLADVLLYRTLELKKTDYDYYFQRSTCMNWNVLESRCEAKCEDCDGCSEYRRIKEQYCVRCGKTFFEREENKMCSDCRRARKKQAQKKWSILSQR